MMGQASQGQMQGYDQQMQQFNMGGEHGGYAFVMNQDGSQMGQQMGQMQGMMAGGGGGCPMQQMVLVTMMPDQQGQQGMVMDPNGCQGCQGCGQAQAPNNWGQQGMGHCNGCSAQQGMPQEARMPQGQQVQQMQSMPDKRGNAQQSQQLGVAFQRIFYF